MRGFQLAISTILVLIVFLITAVIVLFFFTDVFGTSGEDIVEIAATLDAPAETLKEGEGPGEGLEGMDEWANPFD